MKLRRIVLRVCLAAAFLVFALMSASVAKPLLFKKAQANTAFRAIFDGSASTKELLDCNQKVQDLLNALENQTSQLTSKHDSNQAERTKLWGDFSRAWQNDWDRADMQCAFTELADQSMGAAYDRMAQVHSDLPSMRLKHESLIIQFENELATELTHMKRALNQSKKKLIRRSKNKKDVL